MASSGKKEKDDAQGGEQKASSSSNKYYGNYDDWKMHVQQMTDIIYILIQELKTDQLDGQQLLEDESLAYFNLFSLLFGKIQFKREKMVNIHYGIKPELIKFLVNLFQSFDHNPLSPIQYMNSIEEIIVSQFETRDKSISMFIIVYNLFVAWIKDDKKVMSVQAVEVLLGIGFKFFTETMHDQMDVISFAKFCLSMNIEFEGEFAHLLNSGEFLRAKHIQPPVYTHYNEQPDADEYFERIDGYRFFNRTLMPDHAYFIFSALRALQRRDVNSFQNKFKIRKGMYTIIKESLKTVIELLESKQATTYDFLSMLLRDSKNVDPNEYQVWKFDRNVPSSSLQEEDYDVLKVLDIEDNYKLFISKPPPFPKALTTLSPEEMTKLSDELGFVTDAEILAHEQQYYNDNLNPSFNALVRPDIAFKT
uniref:Uncharacterized protein n=1 Tax=Panagrolaimus superbus TaxID=310955 RepID=A0A914Z2L7_9BILA